MRKKKLLQYDGKLEMHNEKILKLISIILIITIQTGCISIPSMRAEQLEKVINKETVYAEEYTRKIIACLNDGDKKELMKIFSSNASSTIEDFDERVADVFNYFRGSIVSFELNKNIHSEGSSKGILRMIVKCEVETDADNYMVIYGITPIDKSNPKNVGINMFHIYNQQDQENVHNYGIDDVELFIPG